MPKKISNQRKLDVLNYIVDHTWKEASKEFGVSEMSISRWLHGKDIEPTNNTNNNTNDKLTKDFLFLKSLFENEKVEIYTSRLTPEEKVRLDEI